MNCTICKRATTTFFLVDVRVKGEVWRHVKVPFCNRTRCEASTREKASHMGFFVTPKR